MVVKLLSFFSLIGKPTVEPIACTIIPWAVLDHLLRHRERTRWRNWRARWRAVVDYQRKAIIASSKRNFLPYFSRRIFQYTEWPSFIKFSVNIFMNFRRFSEEKDFQWKIQLKLPFNWLINNWINEWWIAYWWIDEYKFPNHWINISKSSICNFYAILIFHRSFLVARKILNIFTSRFTLTSRKS